jgi:hypothetical protein
MRIRWDLVKGNPVHEALVASITRTAGQRSRQEKRAYMRYCRKAIRRGILVPVGKKT